VQRGPHFLRRVDVAGFLTGLRIEAVVVRVMLQSLASDNRAVFTGDLTQRGLDRLANDLCARATPPPGMMPPSTAARVAYRLSSPRSLKSDRQ
jgi:hypothetical protein